MATVQQIYIAIFGRPADPVGLAYWNEQTNNGADLSAMIAAFTAAPEYEARFEGQSNEEIISSIYQSLFGREPDDEGLEFYAEALANGELPIETIAVRILDGAQNEDQTSIENKTEVANKFTASIDTPEEIEAYQGTEAATEAQEFLETVTDDPESVPTDEEVEQAVEEVNEGDYNPPEEEPEEPGTPGGGGGDTTDPVFTSGATAAVDENVVDGTPVYTAEATDAGDVTYSLSGTDAAAFTIDADTGEVTINDSPDFETKPSYSFDVLAEDEAGNEATQTVTLSVNDLDEEDPVFTSGATAAVDENVVDGTPVYTAEATDAGDVTYSLSGTDAAAFTIDAGTGEVKINDSPDFETKSSYTFEVIATDDAGNDALQTVTLSVNDLDEGQNANLTTGDDTFTGSPEDDILNAIIDDSSSTLNLGDDLDGGDDDGNDILDIAVNGSDTESVLSSTSTVSITNFETVNLSRSAPTDTDASVDASIFVGAQAIWQLGQASDVVNIGGSTTVGFDETTNTGGGAGGPVIDLQFTGTTGSIALDNVADGSAFGIVGANLTTLNISGSVADDEDSDSVGQLQLWTEIGNQPAFETVNLSMSSETDLALYEPIPGGNIEDNSFFGATTFNGQGSTGGLVITPTGIPVTDFIAWETFSTGSGNDTVSVDLASFSAEAVSLSLGIGDDDLTLNANGEGGTNANLAIDLGEGSDTLRFTDDGIANITLPGGDVTNGLITVTGFDIGETLEFGGTLSATNKDAVDPGDNASLVDAVNAAIDGSPGSVVFEFNGSSYLYVDNDTVLNEFVDGDGLVEFVGLSANELASYVTP